MKVLLLNILIFISLVFFSFSAFSDEVFLNNGDRLTGSVLSKTGEVLILKTGYAGEIEIQWWVKHLVTDEPVKIALKDETDVEGILVLKDESEQQIANVKGDSEPLDVQQIAVINPAEEPKFKFSGFVNFDLEIDRGNTDEDDYHVDGDMTLRWPEDRARISFVGDYEEKEGSASKQEADLGFDYDQFVTEKYFTTVGSLFEHDRFSDLDLRSTVSVGAGYQFFENSRTNLSIEGGPGYLWENFNESDDQNYPIGLWRVSFDHNLFEKWKLQTFHKHRYTQSLEDGDDFIFLSSTGLRIPINKHFQSTIQYNFDWDNEPADDTEENDRETLITAGYRR